jgi:hypothetical protein
LQVKGTKLPRRPHVTAAGDGIAGHAGSLLLHELADRSGLTEALSQVLAPHFPLVRRHDPGAVLRDLAVMIADGGDCLADLCTLRDHPDLFGAVASDPTAWRLIDRLQQVDVHTLETARAAARQRVWGWGLQPPRIILDLDATLVTAHSDKEDATPTWKRGYGFHPNLCTVDDTNETLSGRLRPGNATANNANDNLEVLDAALLQLPTRTAAEPILVRGDSAMATHKFVNGVRERELRFSVGFDLTESVRQAVLQIPDRAWGYALDQEGEERDGADVAELTHLLDLSAWPSGTRAICRREMPHPGAQLTFTDHHGYRFQVFITDQPDADIAFLEARHRGHARVEDRIRSAKDTGLRNLPFSDFGANAVWLQLVLMACDLMAWAQGLLLEGEARVWEPKRLRYAVLHIAARIIRSGRQLHLRLQRAWRWSAMLARAFARLRRVPATG